MHGTATIWTSERDCELAIMWNEGMTLMQIAAHFPFIAHYANNGISALTRHVDYLRETAQSDAERIFWTRLVQWTHEHDIELVRLWNDGLPRADIAKQLSFLSAHKDKGLSAVISRIGKLRASSVSAAERLFWTRRHAKNMRRRRTVRRMHRGVRKTKSPWCRDRVADLARRWWFGYSAQEIADSFPWLATYPKHGRSAVIGMIKRLRDDADHEAERFFWTRGRAPKMDPAQKKRRVRRAQSVSTKPKAKRAAYVRTQRVIEDSKAHAVPVTKADAIAHFQQCVRNGTYGNDKTAFVPWTTARGAHTTAKKERTVPRCTEPIGPGPCGKDAFANTARCIDHGGEQLARIRYTDEQHKKPWLLAAE